MKKTPLILVLFFALSSWLGSAQVLNESFDSATLPDGWTQEYVNKSDNWVPVTNNMFGVDPHSGSHMAQFQPNSFGGITKLITPSMNLTGIVNPQLNFFYVNLFLGVNDDLKIYYKTSASGTWEQIGEDYIHAKNDWTEVTLNLPNASNDYFIAFEAKSNWGAGVNLDDVTVGAGPTCLNPVSLRASNLTATSALLSWTESGTATTWNVEYGPTGFTPGSGTMISDITGTADAIITGLTAATSYDFYVNADCGSGDISPWSGPKQFSTTCTPISSFPWTEGFEGIEIPAVPSCWTVVDHNNDGDKFETDNGKGVDGSIGVGLYTSFNNGNNDDYLILPPFNLNENQKLSFYTLLLDAAKHDEFEVLLSTTENDIEDFTTVLLPPTLVNTAGPNLVEVDLTDYSGIVHIAVHIPNSTVAANGYYIYFDNFSIVDVNLSCFPVTDLTASPLGDGTVDVSWTPGDDETEWAIEYGAPGFTLGTGTVVTVNDEPEHILTGLNSNTSYELYVTSICGEGDESTPTGPVSFRTQNTDGCGQSQVSNNFEEAIQIQQGSDYGAADDFTVSVSTINFSVETISANMFVGGEISTMTVLFFEDNAGLPGTQIGSTIQNIVPTSQNIIGAFGNFDVREVVLDLPTAVDFGRGPNGEEARYWVQLIGNPVDPSSPVGWETTSVGRIGKPTALSYQGEPWYTNNDSLDTVFSISGTCELEDCPGPTNLSATDITETSAFLSWNPQGTETEWEIEYGLGGFELGTGTIIEDTDGIIGEIITGLSASTHYEFYVTPICGGEPGITSGPKGFNSACGGPVVDFPFVETFEDNSGSRDCWINEHVTGDIVNWNYVATNGNNSITPRSGELMAQYKSFDPGSRTKLVSPAMDLTSLTTPQLTFYYANTEWVGDVDELRVYYKTSEAGTWTQIGTAITSEHTVWTEVILDLPNASSEYFVAFEGQSNYARGIDIDDVMIAEAPTCMQPRDLVANHMTQDSVELSWSSESSATSGFEYYVFLANEDPTTATPAATGTTDEGVTSVNVTDLTPFTVYDFYVKSLCEDDNFSNLTGPVTFKTAMIPPVCGEKFYDTGGPNGDYSNDENTTWIISPPVADDVITVTFTEFDVENVWDALYVFDGPDASYPQISSGNPATPHFPAGGFYGLALPGPFTSTHSSGALTFVFRSDYAFPSSGWVADITCNTLSVEDQKFGNFTYYPNPVDNTLNLSAKTEIEKVVIYNLLGQEVRNIQPKSMTPTLELGDLQTGAYLMKVSIDGNENTYRLIKK